MELFFYLIEAFFFVLSHYLVISAFALVSYLLGRRVTKRFVFHSRLEQTSFALATGLALLAGLTLLLGLLGLLYRWLAIALLAALMWWAYPIWAAWPKKLRSMLGDLKSRVKSLPLFAVIFAAILVFTAPILLLPLYPPTGYDAIMYHLPYSKSYVENHGLVITPYLAQPVSPQNNDMLFTLGLLLYDDMLAQLIELLILVITTLAVSAFGQRYFSPKAGWWAAAIWLANPLVIWLGTTAYVDLGLTLFVMMAVYALCNWLAAGEGRWLVMTGVFCGFAIGVKFLALFTVAQIAAAVWWTSLKNRLLAPLLVFGLLCLLLPLPWLARNFYYTGNPVYPILHTSFGRFVSPEWWHPEYSQFAFGAESFRPGEEDHWGYKRLSALLKLPWNLVFNYRKWVPPAPLSPLYLVMLPFLLLLGFRRRRIRIMLVSIALYTVLWFYTVQDLRYLVPTLPLLSLVTAVALERMSGWLTGRRVAALGFLILVAPAPLYAAFRMHVQGALPVTQEQRNEYLTRWLPSYPAYRFINRLKGKNYSLFVLYDNNMAYYADGVFMGGSGKADYSQVIEDDRRLVNGQTLYDRLKALGVSHFLVDEHERQVELPQDLFFREHFQLIFELPLLQLFELK